MNRLAKVSAVAAVAVLALVGTGCDKLKARDHLNRGVTQFKGARYGEAIEHFKSAVELDPTYTNARLYLATAYMSQYIPGADSPENVQNAKAANDQFLKVLEQDPNNTVAIASLASLHYNQAQGANKDAQLDEAKKWYLKLIEVDPKN